MEILSINRGLNIKDQTVVSFYGAGGKTTLIHRLAEEMRSTGKKVLITTTTKMYKRADLPLVLSGDPNKAVTELKKQFERYPIVVSGRSIISENKIEGFDRSQIEHLAHNLPVSILVEADGSRGKSVKGYDQHEPVLPDRSDLLVPVIGLDSLGQLFKSEHVHRLEQLLKITGSEKGQPIMVTHLAKILIQMIELGREQVPLAMIIPLLNKVDTVNSPNQMVAAIARELIGCRNTDRLLATAGNDANPVKVSLDISANRPIASVSCVVLAAGSASRMGADKLLLRYKDKTILEHTLDQISQSGIDDLVLVVKPGCKLPSILTKSGVRIIENGEYASGIASSLKAGLSTIDHRAQGVLFALADQPLIPVQIYRQLIENYQKRLKLITCPTYQGKRGNPVLFDRRTWPDLMELTGDQGGRQIIHSLAAWEIDYLETGTPAIL
ncbi:MAG: selenium cofactor biosynthesis protein YqeC, partial [Clostridia bacterium]|nr:selenium cofactor biosynthesis protein YqeC [Clostridia bacterium]